MRDLTAQEVFDCLPKGEGPVLLAVSGGVDSMVMAHTVLSKSSDVAVAHCNFHLRGEESDSDQSLVERFCNRFGVKLFVEHFDTLDFASANGVSVEMAARELRYRWFEQLCRTYGFSAVCVAHNANDNVETVVLNLLRGTGIKGLCGMGERTVNPYGTSLVFRPLLGFSRQQIEGYAEKYQLDYHTDSTNLCSDYKRNRIRNEIFPQFARINPSFLETLSRDISNFTDVSAIVDDCFKDIDEFFVKLESERITIPLCSLRSHPHWKYGIYLCLSRYGFNRTVIDSLSKLLESERIISGRRFFSSDFQLTTTSAALIVEPLSVETQNRYSITEEEWTPERNPRTKSGEIILDADKIQGEPVIRKWEPGDWLRPIGLNGKKKVSDMLTDLKYDLSSKERVCVVQGTDSHVLAVVGERIDVSVAVGRSTTRIYRISIV